MEAFSKDVDLMKFEPQVFGVWYLSSQLVCGADNGLISGTQFSTSGVDFVSSGVEAGSVIWLESDDESIQGAFEVVEVLGTTTLTVSVVRLNDQQEAVPIGAMSGLTWRIVRYDLQAYEVLWRMSQRLGLQPGCGGADYSVDDIVETEPLRQASVFGVLAMIFTSLYRGLEGQDILQEKAAYYREQFEAAMEQVRVQIDTDGDGDAERTIGSGMVRLVRE